MACERSQSLPSNLSYYQYSVKLSTSFNRLLEADGERFQARASVVAFWVGTSGTFGAEDDKFVGEEVPSQRHGNAYEVSGVEPLGGGKPGRRRYKVSDR